MSISFARKKSKAEQAEEALQSLSEEERENALAYRDRARQERQRFVKATDTEFWLCLCYRDLDELDRWRSEIGFGENHQFYRYADVKNDLKCEQKKTSGPSFGAGVSFGSGISFGAGLSFGKAKYDPLSAVVYEDDLEKDCLSELKALHQEFLSAKAPKALSDVTDSDIWIVLVFEDRDAKENFIDSAGAIKDQQDKYVDAQKLAEHLGAHI